MANILKRYIDNAWVEIFNFTEAEDQLAALIATPHIPEGTESEVLLDQVPVELSQLFYDPNGGGGSKSVVFASQYTPTDLEGGAQWSMHNPDTITLESGVLYVCTVSIPAVQPAVTQEQATFGPFSFWWNSTAGWSNETITDSVIGDGNVHAFTQLTIPGGTTAAVGGGDGFCQVVDTSI